MFRATPAIYAEWKPALRHYFRMLLYFETNILQERNSTKLLPHNFARDKFL